jgi:hypothetical protein
MLRTRVTGSTLCERWACGRLFTFCDWCAGTIARWENEIVTAGSVPTSSLATYSKLGGTVLRSVPFDAATAQMDDTRRAWARIRHLACDY